MSKKTKDIQPISALQIAKFFVWKSKEENKPITNKKLQKLLYYSQAWNLVMNNRPLFEEPIEAWVHGPAIKTVYDKYKKFGFSNINESVSKETVAAIPELDLLEEIWRVYGKYDAAYLEQLTHNEEPWQLARLSLDSKENSENVISLDSMKSYYSSLLAQQSKK